MSSNDRKDPRSDVTQYEYRTSDVAPKRAHTVFGIAPVVTQPFDAFTDPGAAPEQPAPAAPNFASTTRLFAPSIPPQRDAGGSAPTCQAPPVPSAVQVSVVRLQGIGQQVVGQPADARPDAAPASQRSAPNFGHTVVAAGHSPLNVPAARAPVSAYPTPGEGLRRGPELPAYQAPTPREPARSEAAREAPSAAPEPALPVEPARTRLRTHVREQQAVTTAVDVHKLLQKYPVHMPELGGSTDSSSQWSAPVTEPPISEPRRPEPERRLAHRERPHFDTDDKIDTNLVLGIKNPKLPMMIAALVVALGLMAVSFAVKRSSGGEVAVAPEAAPASPAAAAGVPPQQTEPAGQESAQQAAPEQVTAREQSSTREQPSTREQRRARKNEPLVNEAPAGKAPAPHAAGSVTATSAAALYINGQYKEALAEYRLLSRAYPREAVYGELARILRRKLIDTCLRTQPHRQEQCKEI